MDWTAVGALAEAIGAAGVILSLLYVGLQVRQNTKVARAATRQALADGAQGLATDVLESEEIARLMHKALEGRELEPHEILRLQARCLRDLRFWDNAYYQYTEGLLTPEEWEPFRENLRLIFQFPTYREYWERLEVMFSTPFRSEVNSLLELGQPLDLRDVLGQATPSAEE